MYKSKECTICHLTSKMLLKCKDDQDENAYHHNIKCLPLTLPLSNVKLQILKKVIVNLSIWLGL